MNMGKELRRTWSRRLNCIQKVCCHEFIKISTFSVHFFLPAAEAGDKGAQYNFGNMFYHGNGVEASLIKATEWYQKGMLL
jgi:hypothetical protein